MGKLRRGMEIEDADTGLLTSSSEPEGAAELQKLRQAFTSLGSFQIGDKPWNGSSFLEKVHEVGRQFFALPMEEKKKYMRTADVAEGYGTSGQRPHAKDETLDWSDRLYLLALPENQQKPRFWPRKPHNLRIEKWKACKCTLKDEKWFRVPVVPNTLTINDGDQLEVTSNGIFKSSMHRVSTNAEKERLTLAMFCMCQTEKKIEPVEELITNETPRIYKNVILNLDFYTKNYNMEKEQLMVSEFDITFF